MNAAPPLDPRALWRRRAGPIAVVAGVALIAGTITGAGHTDGRKAVVRDYVRAWSHGDYATMYAAVSQKARSHVALDRFTELYQSDARLATATGLATDGPVVIHGHTATVPLRVSTRIFGVVRAPVSYELRGDGADAKIDWHASSSFPGLRDGEHLHRRVEVPPRATLETRDGGVLAKGAGRTPDSDLADVAGDTVGELGSIPPERAAELTARGIPGGTKVGVRGLERALDDRLLGRPGGTLEAGGRILASSDPEQAPAVRSTISPKIERATIAALQATGKTGGVVVLDPRSGELLGFAGIAFTGLQPPGSTFKMITASGALEYGAAHVSDAFPVQTAATLDGVQLSNANGESCGGTLTQSFADSCNSVFAPLGVKLGAQRLVKTAEAYGFNSPPDIPGAATSTIPAPDELGDDLGVGSSSIGQGQVQATALQMASVAATIGLRGRRPRLTLDLDAGRRDDSPERRSVDTRTARTMEKLMLAVVRSGTGTSAAIPDVKVAGKTGTAELRDSSDCTVDASDPDASPEDCDSASDPTDTDAWFAAYAPATTGHPRVAVGVMLVGAGAGGDTAAPVAKQVLQAALKAG